MHHVCCISASRSIKFGSAAIRPSFFSFSPRSFGEFRTARIRMEKAQNELSNGANTEFRGACIVLEGLDRSGKTSQSTRLVAYLEGLGHSAELWRFPDRTTSVGQMISSYLSNGSQLDDHTVHLLFSANRWEKRSVYKIPVCLGLHGKTRRAVRKWENFGKFSMRSKLYEARGPFYVGDRKFNGYFIRTVDSPLSSKFNKKRSLMERKLKAGTSLIIDRYSFSGVAFSSAKGLDFDWCKAPEIGLLAPDLVLYLDIPPEKAAEIGGYGTERYEKLEFQRKVADCYKVLQDPSWKVVDAQLHIEEISKQVQEGALECVEQCREGKRLSLLWSS